MNNYIPTAAFVRRIALPCVCALSIALPAQDVRGQARATGNSVLRWNAIAHELSAEFGPIIDARAFAVLHASIHDAVNGVERRYAPYTAELSSPGASLDAAVATAAHDVLMALAPRRQTAIDSLYASALAGLPDGPAKRAGVTLGRQAARENLERRRGDQIVAGAWPPATGPVTEPVYTPTGRPGDYAFTPPFDQPPMGPIALFPGWGRLRPFAVDLAAYALAGPPPLASDAYALDVERVQSVGALRSRSRTPEQTEIARFWFEDFPLWSQIAARAVERRGLDAWDAARTLALVHLAIADASIACFAAKYQYRFWRPYTAIRRAGEDGNPRTVADTEWLPLLWSAPDAPHPTFFIPPIPEYPSAAATISGAAAEVLATTLGDQQLLAVTSPFLPGVTRRFTGFRAAAEEAGQSRVYGGIHFPTAVRDGDRVGRRIGQDVSRLLPRARP